MGFCTDGIAPYLWVGGVDLPVEPPVPFICLIVEWLVD